MTTAPLTPMSRVGAVIGTVMMLLGVFVLVRLFLNPNAPLAGTRGLDIAFGVFFVARGALSFWTIHRRRRG